MTSRPFLLLLSLLALLPGCAEQQKLKDAQALYASGRYGEAYQAAAQAATSSDPKIAGEAAYVAGLSALSARPRDLMAAEQYLLKAARQTDTGAAAAAQAQLGLCYAEQGRFDLAAQALEGAAPRLDGQNRANAYYQAGLSLQKLGQWDRARSDLNQARMSSSDPAFQRQATDLMGITGYTLQLGSYSSDANARKAAQDYAARLRAANLGAPRLAPGLDAAGKPIYRLQIGAFNTYDTAVAALPRLGIPGAIVAPLRTR